MDQGDELARLIEAHRAGDERAFDELVGHAYRDIHALAHRQRRRGPSVTLDTTSLAHEAYLRLAEATGASYADSPHFFAIVAKAMRYILIDYARSRSAVKRGGDWRRVELTTGVSPVSEERMLALIAIDQALRTLDQLNPELVRVVECRYFAGLTEIETAKALAISVSSVQRHWRLARAQLRLLLDEAPP